MNRKSLLRLIIIAVAAFFLVKLCTSNLGSVINLPGGTGDSGSNDSGGWFSPKNDGGSSTNDPQDKTVEDIAREIEKELGIGKGKGTTTTQPQTQAGTTTSVGTSLSFKGIPISGTLSEFGSKLVKAGFKSSGNGTYTGDFAGYSGCKITPIGNPVYEVRVDFPVISDWNSLEKSYDSLQASLTQKYGMEPVLTEGTNVATYNVPDGTITLDADVKEQSSWHVILKYTNPLTTGSSTGSLGRNPIDDL